MTSAAEGRELTQVGAGTVMGELMRQYWIPAAQSAELVRDGAPIRLMLLGEKLIAFRDTEGRVGVMDHRCPHRCGSQAGVPCCGISFPPARLDSRNRITQPNKRRTEEVAKRLAG